MLERCFFFFVRTTSLQRIDPFADSWLTDGIAWFLSYSFIFETRLFREYGRSIATPGNMINLPRNGWKLKWTIINDKYRFVYSFELHGSYNNIVLNTRRNGKGNMVLRFPLTIGRGRVVSRYCPFAADSGKPTKSGVIFLQSNVTL